MESEPRLITRQEFSNVGFSHGKIPSVNTRAWHAAVEVAHFHLPKPGKPRFIDVIEFPSLMSTVREIEKGEVYNLLGKTAWDIIADINNADLSANDPDYLVPWTDWIHRRLNGGEQTRTRATERLQEVYDTLAQVATADLVAVQQA